MPHIPEMFNPLFTDHDCHAVKCTKDQLLAFTMVAESRPDWDWIPDEGRNWKPWNSPFDISREDENTEHLA